MNRQGRPAPTSALQRVLRAAGDAAEVQFGRAASAAVPVMVEAVDLETVLDRVDLDRLLDRVDVNGLLARVDLDQLLERVDLNDLLDRVDVDRLLDRLDVDRLLDRVDVERVARRAGISGMVAEGTGQVTASALDLARRQLAGLDTVVLRVVDRLLGRAPGMSSPGPPQLVREITTP